MSGADPGGDRAAGIGSAATQASEALGAASDADQHPAAESFRAIDARLALMHGYAAALGRIEGKLDETIRALKAGAIGAWGNAPRE